MNTEFSNWSVEASGKFVRNGKLKRKINVVYLDDHSLFRRGVIEFCLQPCFPDVNFICHTDGTDAYDYIRLAFRQNQNIDMLITDMNHPGFPGDKLAEKVRELEHEFGITSRMPIILFTMVEENRFPALLENKTIDHYFSKATEPALLIDCIENYFYRD